MEENLTSTEPQVIESATPMDSNTTYDSLPRTEYQPNMTPVQNMINDAVQTSNQINTEANAGSAMNNFLTKEYDYNKNEAGSYWVAGAINDNNTQMSFLQTLINEEMYDEMDLQKYYYDTNLATARAYAAQKSKEVAYGFYRAAQERALAEGELTGWYMPAEGRYMLGQYTVAQNTLENPDATPEDISKASRITNTVEKWFSANQITSRGIKCLGMMNYEENVRHNTIIGELQKEANKIAAMGAAASGAAAELQLREFKFQVEEMELQSGYDFSNAIGLDKDNYIGHNVEKDYKNLQALRGYDTTADMLSKDASAYAAVLGASNRKYIDAILENRRQEILKTITDDMTQEQKDAITKQADQYSPKNSYKRYYNDQTLARFKVDINSNKKITSKSFESTGKKVGNNEIKYAVVGNEVIAGYFEDGVWMSLKGTEEFSNGTSVKTYFENMFGEGSLNAEGVNSVTIDGETYSFGRTPTDKMKTSYSNLKDLGWQKAFSTNWDIGNWEKIDETSRNAETYIGTKDSDGDIVRNLTYCNASMDEDKINEYTIFKSEKEDGSTQYYTVNDSGKLKKIDASGIKEIGSVKDNLKVGDTIDLNIDLFSGDSTRERIGKASWIVGYDKKSNTSYMAYPHNDGSVEYYSVKGNVKVNSLSSYKIKAINLTDKDITNAGFKAATSPDTTVTKETNYNANQDQTKINPKNTKVSGNSSSSTSTAKGLEPTIFEKKDAIFEKYDIPIKERFEYSTITDINVLEEKIKKRYEGILGQGGDQNGK